jgi:hypothetical protein
MVTGLVLMVGNFESFSLEPGAEFSQGPHGLHDAFFNAMRPKLASLQSSDLPAAAPRTSAAGEPGAVTVPEAKGINSPEAKGASLPEGRGAVAPAIAQDVPIDTAEQPAVPEGTEIAAAAPEEVSDAPVPAGPVPEIPPPIQSALESGSPIVFTSSGENQAANRQPDYFMTPSGQMVKNENAQPSPDGTINIEIQSAKPEGNKSLRDAIIYETEMQKQSAMEMIRFFQKSHPGAPIPEWMNNLANAKPNLPDFVPATSAPTAPPENGFVNRGVAPGHTGGFAGNGGFDGGGNFRGNGSVGDGSLYSGASDNAGRPLGPGETVQAKSIYDYLTTNYGMSDVAASGILGNMMTESSMKTNAHNSTEGAIGLCQWEGPRRRELEHFAAEQHKPVTDWHVQVDFMMHELKGSESGAYAKLQHAQTPAQAAAIFDKFYERSAGTSRGERMGNAEHVHRQLAVGSVPMV